MNTFIRIFLALASWSALLPAFGQNTYVLDTTFQTILRTDTAGDFVLYANGRDHFVARTSIIGGQNPFVEYDTTGQATGRVFSLPAGLFNIRNQEFGRDGLGNMYVIGSHIATTPAPNEGIAVRKFRADGVVDSSYGQHGVLYLPATEFYRQCEHLHVFPDGVLHFVLAETRRFVPREYLLYKTTPAGELDSTWAQNGTASLVTTDMTRPAQHFHTASDGTLYGTLRWNNTSPAELLKWWPDGSPDTSFVLIANDVKVVSTTPDGRIVVLLDSTKHFPFPYNPYPPVLFRHYADGTMDASYTPLTLQDTLFPQFHAMWPRPGGGFQISFTTVPNVSLPYGHDFHLYSYNSDGSPDLVAMPNQVPADFFPYQSHWYFSGCRPFANQSFRQILMLNNRRLILSDAMYSVEQLGTSAPFIYYTCPRIISISVAGNRSLGMADALGRGQVSAFPNPFADHFSLRIPTRARSAQVQLYDLAGKALSLPPADVAPFDGGLQYAYQGLDGLPTGLYLLRVEAAGQVFTAKVHKE